MYSSCRTYILNLLFKCLLSGNIHTLNFIKPLILPCFFSYFKSALVKKNNVGKLHKMIINYKIIFLFFSLICSYYFIFSQQEFLQHNVFLVLYMYLPGKTLLVKFSERFSCPHFFSLSSNTGFKDSSSC